MPSPVTLREVVPPSTLGRMLADRYTNPILLAPLLGAFGDLLVRHRVPSLVWPFLVLASALATRVLKKRTVARERAAILGADGLFVEERFLGVTELASVEHAEDVVRVTTRQGEQIELHAAAGEQEEARSVAAALSCALAASSAARDTAGEALLAEQDLARLRASGAHAYRGLAFDEWRCLAVAEDPAAAPRARVVAATLLAGHPDAAIRVRVAEAVSATANPALREVLGEVHAEPAAPLRRSLGRRS